MIRIFDLDIKYGNYGIQILTFSGECIFADRPKRVDDLLAKTLEKTPKHLIVDFSGCSLLDSSAIGTLIAYHNKLRDKVPDARMAVVTGVSNYLVRKLSNLGVFNYAGIEIFKTLQEAESSLSGK
ncbi:MAG: STAS domain-containing protein [Firmicutes bacterium]|nr:STAS domain-containing protein [Bacillota bacterium]